VAEPSTHNSKIEGSRENSKLCCQTIGSMTMKRIGDPVVGIGLKRQKEKL
jgi:hypothetical protein